MNEAKFWGMIEIAWQAVGSDDGARAGLTAGESSDDEVERLTEQLETVVSVLRENLDQLSPEELLEFDHILERRLYDLDREEIHEQTDGSDDGFLYARGFIVAMGEDYYNAVKADPAKAVMNAESEEMCYLSWHLYNQKYGEMPRSEISRESGSNQSGWN